MLMATIVARAGAPRNGDGTVWRRQLVRTAYLLIEDHQVAQDPLRECPVTAYARSETDLLRAAMSRR
jgi:hypothetical protein